MPLRAKDFHRFSYTGFIVVGDAPNSEVQPTAVTSDARGVVISRPARSQVLHDAIASKSAATSKLATVGPPLSPTEIPTDLHQQCPLAIMIVDDNQINRLVFLRVAQRLGYQKPDLAVDGLDAIERCRQKQYVAAQRLGPFTLLILLSCAGSTWS